MDKKAFAVSYHNLRASQRLMQITSCLWKAAALSTGKLHRVGSYPENMKVWSLYGKKEYLDQRRPCFKVDPHFNFTCMPWFITHASHHLSISVLSFPIYTQPQLPLGKRASDFCGEVLSDVTSGWASSCFMMYTCSGLPHRRTVYPLINTINHLKHFN